VDRSMFRTGKRIPAEMPPLNEPRFIVCSGCHPQGAIRKAGPALRSTDGWVFPTESSESPSESRWE
jgi:hypothetical protein